LARLLKPDGVLILSTPQRWSVMEVCAAIAFLPGIIQLVRAVYRESVEPTGHINLLTPHRLAGQLDAAGFRTITTFCSGLYLPLMAEFGGFAARRLLGWLERRFGDGLLRGALWTQYYVLKRR
jgi:hypothetical protein